MAKSEIYLNKIETYKKESVIGFRLKQTMYLAKISCSKEGIEFEYQSLLETYCIPGTERYISDEKYYLIIDDKIIESDRTKKPKELFLEEISKMVGGKVVFSKDKDPMVLVDGFLLHATVFKENSNITEEVEESFATPYDLYPRVINVKEDRILVETEKEKCEWRGVDEWKDKKYN